MASDLALALAHITSHDVPAGLAMFLAGLGTGVGLSAAVYWRFFRSR